MWRPKFLGREKRERQTLKAQMEEARRMNRRAFEDLTGEVPLDSGEVMQGLLDNISEGLS